MTERKSFSLNKGVEIMLHIIVWTYVFISPLLFKHGNQSINWNGYAHGLIFPLTDCIMFYVNYFVFVPRNLSHAKWGRFVGLNLLVVFLLLLLREVVFWKVFPMPEMAAAHPKPHHFQSPWAHYVRGFVSLMFVAVVATTLRLALQWKKSEAARREAELRRSEAELSNLKNQINPHFLLNTLNNIYALTAFNPEKAQVAIQELSKMLRYILYENHEKAVSLQREADFLQNYIRLMQMRLPEKVSVETDFQLSESEDLRVAPLIFISLVENAFKHGVSSTEPSFIRIRLSGKDGKIHFSVRNSNFPKDKATDKAPGGIGMQQVRQRLEYSYPQKYIWNKGFNKDGTEYFSEITLL